MVETVIETCSEYEFTFSIHLLLVFISYGLTCPSKIHMVNNALYLRMGTYLEIGSILR